jgi:hypothetical protein
LSGLQPQSWIVVTETIWLVKHKIFPVWTFVEKVWQPWSVLWSKSFSF